MSLAKESALDAKIAAMRSRLLKTEDYLALASCKSVTELAAKLKGYSNYSYVLEGFDPSSTRRGFLERRLSLTVPEDFKSIYRFVGDFRLRGYLDAFFLKDEIDTLKFILNSVCDQRETDYTPAEISTLLANETSRIDVGKLLKSKSIPEFMENLKGAEFYPVLAKKYRNETPTLFELKFELDLYYFLHLDALAKKFLDKQNRKAMQYIIGSDADLKNIMWTYRLHKFHGMYGNALFPFLIPLRHRLKKSALIKMAECKTIPELESEIANSPYAATFADKTILEKKYYEA
ncbi:MAG: V-type ATPase subunit, partial [Clostridiales bacterium]|nr:V-type ATPase subunit [Clostridiales bacterium]